MVDQPVKLSDSIAGWREYFHTQLCMAAVLAGLFGVLFLSYGLIQDSKAYQMVAAVLFAVAFVTWIVARIFSKILWPYMTAFIDKRAAMNAPKTPTVQKLQLRDRPD